MATIDRRVTESGAITYRARVRVRGQIRTATFDRKTDAKDWAREVESSLKRGRYVPTAEALRRTVGDMVDRYIDDLPHKARNRARARPEQQLRWWKERIGNVPLVDCTPAIVIEQRDRLARGEQAARSPATVNRYLAAISHAFTTAQKEWLWIETNPLRNVSRLEEPKGRIRFLSDNERKRLLEACKNCSYPDLYFVVVLALSTAARRGEILGLRWDAIDVSRGRIVLHDTKNRDRRVLPLTGLALELMRKRAKVRRIDTPLVFPGRRPDRPREINKPWRQVVAAAKLDDFRFHDLRHSAASYLAMNGATLAELAEVLGHRTLAMVKRYAHLTEAHTADVVGRMNERIFALATEPKEKIRDQ